MRTVRLLPYMSSFASVDLCPTSSLLGDQGLELVREWFLHVDEIFSPHLRHSELMRLQRGEESMLTCSDEFSEVLWLTQDLNMDVEDDRALSINEVAYGWGIEKMGRILTEAGIDTYRLSGDTWMKASGTPPEDRWTFPLHGVEGGKLTSPEDGGSVKTAQLEGNGLVVVTGDDHTYTNARALLAARSEDPLVRLTHDKTNGFLINEQGVHLSVGRSASGHAAR